MQQKTQRDPDGNEKGEAPTPISSGAETLRTQPERESPSSGDSLMEAILNPENLKQALKRVKANKGAPGVDEMSVSELPEHLKRQFRAQMKIWILCRRYLRFTKMNVREMKY